MSPLTGYRKASTISSPFEKLPRSSPETKRTPRAESALESCGEESRSRTTVLPEAIPRYSAVTSKGNLPAGVETSVSFFWAWADRARGSRTARIPEVKARLGAFILPSEPKRAGAAFPAGTGSRRCRDGLGLPAEEVLDG